MFYVLPISISVSVSARFISVINGNGFINYGVKSTRETFVMLKLFNYDIIFSCLSSFDSYFCMKTFLHEIPCLKLECKTSFKGRDYDKYLIP